MSLAGTMVEASPSCALFMPSILRQRHRQIVPPILLIPSWEGLSAEENPPDQIEQVPHSQFITRFPASGKADGICDSDRYMKGETVLEWHSERSAAHWTVAAHS
jgi:hypothetical protein